MLLWSGSKISTYLHTHTEYFGMFRKADLSQRLAVLLPMKWGPLRLMSWDVMLCLAFDKPEGPMIASVRPFATNDIFVFVRALQHAPLLRVFDIDC